MTARSLSILFHPKDSPILVRSGYAKVAAYMAPRLMEHGWDVRLQCPVGHQMGVLEYVDERTKRPIVTWPGGSGPYGEDIVPLHLARLQQYTGKPGLLLFTGDLAALEKIPQLARDRSVLAVAWAAVDWEVPTPKHLMEKFNSFLGVIPYSKWGHDVLRQGGSHNLMDPVWLGVDPEVWKPQDPSTLTATARGMGYGDDTFNVFSCFANQFQRKGEQEMLQAVAEFDRRHPEAKIRFFGFTQRHRDWDMGSLVEHLGIASLVRIVDEYKYHMGDYEESDVARMMSCADVVLALGYEGFGLQTLEAQSLDKPVIGLSAAATPELLQAGLLVPPDRDILNQVLMRRLIPSTEKTVEALERAWAVKKGEKPGWRGGREWVLKNATWDHAATNLAARLEVIEQMVADEEIFGPPEPGPLAVERAKRIVEVQPA